MKQGAVTTTEDKRTDVKDSDLARFDSASEKRNATDGPAGCEKVFTTRRATGETRRKKSKTSIAAGTNTNGGGVYDELFTCWDADEFAADESMVEIPVDSL